MKKVMYFLLLSALFVGCSKTDVEVVPDPVANFSFSGDNNFAPNSVVFLNSSENSSINVWDFGDGSTSSEKNPTHIFSKGGTYNVTLSSLNKDLKKAIINKTITIKNAPTKLKINSIIVSSLPFINPTTGASWDSGNGPDVYFIMSPDPLTSTNSYFTTERFDNIIPGNLPLTFKGGLPFTVSSLDLKLSVYFLDHNTINSDVLIGGYTFKVRDIMPTNGSLYPPVLTFENAASELKFKFNVEWLQ